jgi:protein-tyrosine phosphatase
LLAGCLPGDKDAVKAEQKLRALLNSGIRYVINLMENQELDHGGQPFRPYDLMLKDYASELGLEVTCARMSIRDLGVPTPAYMCNILNAVDRAIAEDRPVYVHCWGGKGRTGTVVGCYLARHGIAVGHQVLNLISELRKNDPSAIEPSPETRQQCDIVRAWKIGQ